MGFNSFTHVYYDLIWIIASLWAGGEVHPFWLIVISGSNVPVKIPKVEYLAIEFDYLSYVCNLLNKHSYYSFSMPTIEMKDTSCHLTLK